MAELEDLRLDDLPLNGYGDALTNLVTNPSFEVDTSGWSTTGSVFLQPVGSTLTRVADTSEGVVGGFASEVVCSGTVDQGIYTPVSLIAGISYAMTIRVRRTGGSDTLKIAVSRNASPYPENIVQAAASPSSSAFTEYTGVFTPTATDIYHLYVRKNGTAAVTFRVDAALVARSAGIVRYFDGGIAGYYWTGAAHASTSTSSPFTMESVSMPVPATLAEWIKGADSQGAILAREPLHENRVIEARVRVNQQATMDAALAAIGQLEDKLQECARNTNGLALKWVPGGSDIPALTFRCLQGEIPDMPLDWQGDNAGWWARSPVLTIRLTCLPFGEGTEYLEGTVTSSEPIVSLELAAVPGDVPALGRLVVTDAATVARRYVAWGLESRWYPTSSPPSLTVDSASMITTGFAGSTAADGFAYGGSEITATMRPQVQAICGLGNLSHVGSFRPQLRVWVSAATTIALRLTYQVLDGPLRPLAYKMPVTAGWNHVDLGLITIPQTTLGTQRWTGRIEGYSTGLGGEVIAIDAIWLMPAELYGRARATYSYVAGVLTALDSFNGRSAGTALGGTTAELGGAWATSGAATDFAAADAPVAGDETMARSTASDSSVRYAICGTTDFTDVDASIDVWIPSLNPSSAAYLVARWANSSAHLSATLANGVLGIAFPGSSPMGQVTIAAPTTNAWLTMRLIVSSGGRGRLTLSDRGGVPLGAIDFYDAALGPSGTRATGKVGFGDRWGWPAAATRFYDNFTAAVPAPEPVVCHPGQSIEFRSSETLRKDSTGVYAGAPPEDIGNRFTAPNAGGPGRKARVAVIARRNDIETGADNSLSAGVMDSTTVAVHLTPRYLAIPRA